MRVCCRFASYHDPQNPPDQVRVFQPQDTESSSLAQRGDGVGHAPGVVQADTGREQLFLSPGVRYHITDSMAAYAFMQFAVYRRVNGIQLTSDWNFTSGIFYRFDLFSHA